MERMRGARNVAILLAIAAAVYVLPGGGRAASTFEAALWVAFGGAAAFMGLRLYREHRVRIHGLGDRHRALLYGGIALAVFAYASRSRMWQTGLGELAWFVILACVVYALAEVYRHSRSY